MKLAEKHRRILKQLGLNDAQITLYVTALEQGVLSVLELSRATKIHRQQIYEDAEKLVSLGLFEKTKKERRKYIAANPDQLIKLGEDQLISAEKLLSSLNEFVPSLTEIQNKAKPDVTLRYFEGLEKIEEAYNNELRAARNSEVLSLVGSIEDTFKFFPETFWDHWNKQFVKQKSTSKMLVHYSTVAQKTAKLDNMYGRQTRYLSQFPLKVNIDVFGQTVLIVSFYDEVALWIESPVIAESYRILFKTLWPLAKPFN